MAAGTRRSSSRTVSIHYTPLYSPTLRRHRPNMHLAASGPVSRRSCDCRLSRHPARPNARSMQHWSTLGLSRFMANPLPQPFDKKKVVAENRRARFVYFVEERLEAGIQLTGTEVKSLRQGEGSIAESYANVEGDEVWLINSHIPEYSHGNRLNHQPKRARKLLLKNREISRLRGSIERQGLTLVPLSMYFNSSGKAKV